MPMMPPSRCSGCQRLVTGPCKHCARAHERARGSRQQRGYDEAWVKLRESYIGLHVLCERCAARDVITPSEEVHHKVPFNGIDDPLRLSWDNLEAVCIDCHHDAHKTLKQQGVSNHQRSEPANPRGGKVSQGHDGTGFA